MIVICFLLMADMMDHLDLDLESNGDFSPLSQVHIICIEKNFGNLYHLMLIRLNYELRMVL